MKRIVQYFATAGMLGLMAQAAWGQDGTAVDTGSAVFTNLAPAKDNYDAPDGIGSPTDETYRFGRGTQKDRRLDGFSVGGRDFERIDYAPDVRVRTKSADAGNPGFTPVYESAPNHPEAPYVNRASRASSVEDILESPLMNRGVVNAFDNTGNGLSSGKNIERIDFVYEVGLRANNADQLDIGFAVTDFANTGVESAALAAITGVDGAGNPTSFGDVLRWSSLQPGELVNGSNIGDFNVYTSNDGDAGNPDTQPVLDAALVNSGIHGRFISSDDLGMLEDQVFYGFALFHTDTADYIASQGGDTSLLLNLDSDQVYDPNSSISNQLDPTGGTGHLFTPTDVSQQDFVQPEPGVNLAVLALILVLGNRQLRRRFIR